MTFAASRRSTPGGGGLFTAENHPTQLELESPSGGVVASCRDLAMRNGAGMRKDTCLVHCPLSPLSSLLSPLSSLRASNNVQKHSRVTKI